MLVFWLCLVTVSCDRFLFPAKTHLPNPEPANQRVLCVAHQKKTKSEKRRLLFIVNKGPANTMSGPPQGSVYLQERNQAATCFVGDLDPRVSDAIIWELMLQAGPVGLSFLEPLSPPSLAVLLVCGCRLTQDRAQSTSTSPRTSSREITWDTGLWSLPRRRTQNTRSKS